MPPSITLTATVQNLFGAAVGSSANPAKMRITLCGSGTQLPRIAGTALIARPGPIDVESTNGSFSTSIWGNDQITPTGTYYSIALIDSYGNLVQSAAYQILSSGGASQDLSTLTPIIVPVPVRLSGYVKVVGASGALALSAAGWYAPITFDVGLTGNIATASLSGVLPAQAVQFIIRQDATGNRTWIWPANVKNPPMVNPAANSVSTANFIADDQGKIYPANGWS